MCWSSGENSNPPGSNAPGGGPTTSSRVSLDKSLVSSWCAPPGVFAFGVPVVFSEAELVSPVVSEVGGKEVRDPPATPYSSSAPESFAWR